MASQNSATDPDVFQTTTLFNSYVSKPEITDLTPNFLVKASKNVLIDYAQRVISRNGYQLFGAKNTGAGAITSSYVWHTSDGQEIPIRVWDSTLEFYWNGQWNTMLTKLPKNKLEFAPVFDNNEKEDVLLFVLGSPYTYKWSGGLTKVWKSTSTTLTKQGVIAAATTVAFVAGTPPTITDSNANFLNAGFAAGDTITVTGSTNNSRDFLVASVTAGTITLASSESLVSEAAGSAITIDNGEPTWASARFLFTDSSRKITYNGVEYSYTGGETTATLTGLTAFPNVAVGDFVRQTVEKLANPMAIDVNFSQDLIGVQLNQLILASTQSREVYISSTTDYTDFTLTDPRAPADPAYVTMDGRATCIIPIDNAQQTASSLAFGAGNDEFFQLSYKMSADNTAELVRMIKLKTAAGSGLISKDAICPIKNATAYISREPALDQLSNVETLDSKKNVPLSDPVKDDFDAYDFMNADLIYWKRAIYIALPSEGLVLIYDLMRALWQPPQTIPVSRFSIIDDWLYGHSSITNETYRLFTGTNDNGNFIPQVARFAYNNGGERTRYKRMTEYWTDGYITAGGLLTMNQNLGFAGSVAVKSMTISGTDQTIVTPQDSDSLGDERLGASPLGGASLTPLTGLIGTNAPMLRFFQIDTMDPNDYMEQYVEYDMNTLDGQFAIISHGSNQYDAGTVPVSNKK